MKSPSLYAQAAASERLEGACSSSNPSASRTIHLDGPRRAGQDYSRLITEQARASQTRWLPLIKTLSIPAVRFLAIVTQLVYVKLLTHFLNNRELGSYYFLGTASYSLSALVFVPLDYYQQSRIYEYKRRNISLRSLLLFNKKLLLCFVGLVLAAGGLFAAYRPQFGQVILICATLAYVLYASTTLKSGLNNLQRKFLASVLFLAESAAKIALLVAAAFAMKPSGLLMMWSNVGALAIMTAVELALCKKLDVFGDGSIIKPSVREITRFSYPFTIMSLCNWLQLQGYRLALARLGFLEMIGIYSSVSNLGGSIMSAAGTLFGQMYGPNIYKSMGAYTWRYLRNAFLLVVGIVLLTAPFCHFITLLATRHNLMPYAYVMLLGIGVEGCNFLMWPVLVHLSIGAKTDRSLPIGVISVIAAACCFGIAIALRQINVYSIGICLVASQLVTFAFSVLVLYRTPIPAASGAAPPQVAGSAPVDAAGESEGPGMV